MRKDATLKLETKNREMGFAFGLTDRGLVREENEDSFAIEERDGDYLLGVFDGMGGMRKGDVASAIIKEKFLETAEKEKEWNEETIKRIIHEANRDIYSYSKERGFEGQMGTTAVIGLIKNGEKLYYLNIGDSRLYLLRDGKLKKLTNDHTLVELQRKKGIISEKEAKESNLKNVLTKAVGIRREVEPELYKSLELREDDIILLCSDGLYNMVHEKNIRRVLLNRKLTVKERAERLISMAKRNGGEDNITVVIYDRKGLSRKKSGIKIFILLLLMAILTLILMWMFKVIKL